jgi:hypothetical protein
MSLNMNKISKALLPLLLAGVAFSADAQSRKSLQLVEVFDAGQPQAVILKLYDQQADVICYVLTPERAARKQVEDSLVYEGNNIGAISCLKQRQYVIDVTPPPAAPVPQQQGAMPSPAAARQK